MANRMRCAVLCAVLTLICGAAAQPLGAFTWHLSGDRFVAKVAGQPGVDKWSQQADAAFQQRYAEGYQAGVVDATQGRLWCAPPGMKPLEIDDRIWDELRGRAGSMPGNAAAELIALYVARFPCADEKLSK